jgi:hypothetical protein
MWKFICVVNEIQCEFHFCHLLATTAEIKFNSECYTQLVLCSTITRSSAVNFRGRGDYGLELLLPIHHPGKYPFKIQEVPLPYSTIVSEVLNDNFPGSWIRKAV